MTLNVGQVISSAVDWFTNWVSELFTVEHIAYCLLGMVIGYCWQGWMAWMRNKKIEIYWRPVLIAFCMATLVWVVVSTYNNSRCVEEFQRVLTVRSAISTENDELSIEQRQIIYDWLHTLVFPPPEVAMLDNSDPKRQQWAVQITLDADEKFAESLERQRKNNEERARNPLPESTCRG